MKKTLRYGAAGIGLLAAFIFSTTRCGWCSTGRSDRRCSPIVVWRRHTIPRALRRDTCTATRIHPPEHAFLENTLPSMRAAFDAGADIVEFDIHPTTDGHFAVFHDWTVDCRTEGHGITREHTLAQLKALDVGYGYTADGGKTYPFRGRGVGMMPSLDEVLDAFLDRRFLINIKSNDPDEGVALAKRLRRLPAERRARLMVYGGDAPIAVIATGIARHPRDVAHDARAMRDALHRDRLDRLCPRGLPQQPHPGAGELCGLALELAGRLHQPHEAGLDRGVRGRPPRRA